MKTYAMVLKNTVIGVLPNQETEPRWGPDPDGNPVTAVPCDSTVIIGMIYDLETNTFSEYIPPIPEEPTPEFLTESEERQIDILLNTEYIACLLESQLT